MKLTMDLSWTDIEFTEQETKQLKKIVEDAMHMKLGVREDGYMKPVEVHLGRGTDVQDRKRRGDARS